MDLSQLKVRLPPATTATEEAGDTDQDEETEYVSEGGSDLFEDEETEYVSGWFFDIFQELRHHTNERAEREKNFWSTLRAHDEEGFDAMFCLNPAFDKSIAIHGENRLYVRRSFCSYMRRLIAMGRFSAAIKRVSDEMKHASLSNPFFELSWGLVKAAIGFGFTKKKST